MSTGKAAASGFSSGPWPVVAGGVAALAVAMGIGRFAFTPLLPLMMRDGVLDATTGAEWAAANYGGYLAGALTASLFSGDPRRGLSIALAGVVATTTALALISAGWGARMGPVLMAGAGVLSAWAFVCASSWCLMELARRAAAHRGAWIYMGVGLGILIAGMLAWLGGRQPAAWLWLELALIAAAGALLVRAALRDRAASAGRASLGAASRAQRPSMRRHLGLVLCYGAFGFGYIVPATFLPVMARRQASDPLAFGLTWPLFGLAAVASVALAARWLSGWPRRRVWALAQAIMALGTGLLVASQALPVLAASAVLVGGALMVTTMAGLQLARERLPANPTPLVARMTVAFAAGQIAGPLLVRALGAGGWSGWDALAWANGAATAILAVTAAWLWRAPR